MNAMYKFLELSKGYKTIIDSDLYDAPRQYKWYVDNGGGVSLE